MNFKEFLKSISIYGLLPVFTKFAGFLLVPIYVRVLSKYDFGIVDLILSSIHFVIFAINLEFYSAIGRFFFDRESLDDKQKLISTGLLMTFCTAVIVLTACLILQNKIHDLLFSYGQYFFELRLGFFWAFWAAISTYLSVIPRYEKKAKQYVIYNLISVFAKLFSTIFFVVILKIGMIGIFLGHIIGAICSTILYGLSSKKYFRLIFSLSDFKEISKFAIPLIPGLLFIGIYEPYMRTIISKIYSMETLGIFSFAIRIVTIYKVVEAAIRLSWRPMLYENIKKKNFGNEYKRISDFSGSLLIMITIILTIFSKEILLIIGTPDYYDAIYLIGMVLLGSVLQNLESLRGFGYEIAKKTYLISIINLLTRTIGILFLMLYSKKLGIIGIGIAFLLPNFLSYIIKTNYTKKFIQVSLFNLKEIALWCLLILSIGVVIIDISFYFKISILMLSTSIALPYSKVKKVFKIKQYF